MPVAQQKIESVTDRDVSHHVTYRGPGDLIIKKNIKSKDATGKQSIFKIDLEFL